MQAAADWMVSVLGKAAQGSLTLSRGRPGIDFDEALVRRKNLQEEESWFAAGLFEDRSSDGAPSLVSGWWRCSDIACDQLRFADDRFVWWWGSSFYSLQFLGFPVPASWCRCLRRSGSSAWFHCSQPLA